ncbi:MAG TPA: HEPN domain-containing protein [Stellaceae bacterium]|nr:HEPN domain-containing protein [Stellaceae bacterium]
MTRGTAELLDRARQGLRDARRLRAEIPRIAGREAYLAAFHAAQALIYERTGKLAKTHRGVRSQFARLMKEEPGLQGISIEVLSRGYEVKSRVDYGVGTTAHVSARTAEAIIDEAAAFIDALARLLSQE